MAQAVRRANRRAQSEQPSLSSLLSLIVIVVLLLGGFVYLFRALTTSDWLWFMSDFDAQPSRIVALDTPQGLKRMIGARNGGGAASMEDVFMTLTGRSLDDDFEEGE